VITGGDHNRAGTLPANKKGVTAAITPFPPWESVQ
jgi:hypothetical protein